MGQIRVLVEEVVWNRADFVIVQPPKKKKVGMRRMKSKNKNTGTQKLTVGSKRCYFQTRWHSQMLFPCYLNRCA